MTKVRIRLGPTLLLLTERTDTWLSNARESQLGLDPLDPDVDDDGLTDGQEVKHVTTALSPSFVEDGLTGDFDAGTDVLDFHDGELGTSPTDPDSDGDGYWDGWIRVYNQSDDPGRRDNLVMYMENLESGDGIEGRSERVDAQIGTHQWRGSESSNLHIGELHWLQKDPSEPGDPSDSSVTPAPSLDVEVDYYEGIDMTLPQLRNSLRQSEDNWGLYDVNVSYHISNNSSLSDSDLDPVGTGSGLPFFPEFTDVPCFEMLPPTSFIEANCVELSFHDNESRAYMFVTTTNSGLIFTSDNDVYGRASSNGRSFSPADVFNGNFGMVIFANNLDFGGQNVVRLRASTTIVHETAHHLRMGVRDDSGIGEEVYSGGERDQTPENVSGFARGPNTTKEWSIMTRGTPNVWFDDPINAGYAPFSIEEVSTIEFNSIEK